MKKTKSKIEFNMTADVGKLQTKLRQANLEIQNLSNRLKKANAVIQNNMIKF